MQANFCYLQSKAQVTLYMLLSLPCTYLQAVFTLFVFISKFIAKKRLSFVMTMLVLTSLMTIGSLVFIIYQNFQIYKRTPDIFSMLFFAVPLTSFITQFLLNVLMVFVHRKVMSSAKCTIPKWVYIPSTFFGYHCLSLTNITFKIDDPTEKHSQTLKSYLNCYRLIS